MAPMDDYKGPYLIFSDFDGTIAHGDVGYHTLSHFSAIGNDDLVARWKAQEMSARECLVEEARRISATREEILAYVDGFALEASFAPFWVKARKLGHEVITVSDGLDFYIERLLTRAGLGDITFYANRALFEHHSMKIEFPYSAGCGRCGSCKKERMREEIARRDFSGKVVFIGDGYSDICALEVADVVFAKDDLRRYCVETGRAHFAFESFQEIGDILFGEAPSEMTSESSGGLVQSRRSESKLCEQ